MQVSIHSDGWGNFPNPQRFITTPFRSVFEGTIVRSKITAMDLSAQIAPYRDCRCTIERRTADYLTATQKEIVALYQLERAGGFAARPDLGKSFVSKRLATGAAELRDMITDAWRRSADMSVGMPPVAVRDLESGEASGFDALKGLD